MESKKKSAEEKFREAVILSKELGIWQEPRQVGWAPAKKPNDINKHKVDMALQDLPKEKLIEIIISTNKKRDRLGKKWHKVAKYWKDAFMNACHNQMEVVRENKALKDIIKRHIK